MITYAIALKLATDLIEPGDTEFENPEYVRGMAELLADLFPIQGMPLADRATYIAHDMGIETDIYDLCDHEWRTRP